jgi:hypothetical protein
LEKADISKARHELACQNRRKSEMNFEDRRVHNFFRLVVGIAGGLILLHVVSNILSGFGYRYFFVNDVLLHWLLVAVGVCLVAFAFASGREK